MNPTKGPWHIRLHRKTIVRQHGQTLQLEIDEHYDSTIGPLHIVDRDGRLIAAVASLDGVNEQASNAVLISHVPEIIEKCAAALVGATSDEAHALRELLFRLTFDPKFR